MFAMKPDDSLRGWMMVRVNSQAWEKKYLVHRETQLSAWKSELMRDEDSVAPYSVNLREFTCHKLELEDRKPKKVSTKTINLTFINENSNQFRILLYHEDDPEETLVWYYVLRHVILEKVPTKEELDLLIGDDSQDRIHALIPPPVEPPKPAPRKSSASVGGSQNGSSQLSTPALMKSSSGSSERSSPRTPASPPSVSSISRKSSAPPGGSQNGSSQLSTPAPKKSSSGSSERSSPRTPVSPQSPSSVSGNRSASHTFFGSAYANLTRPAWFFEGIGRDKAKQVLINSNTLDYGNCLMRPKSNFHKTGEYSVDYLFFDKEKLDISAASIGVNHSGDWFYLDVEPREAYCSGLVEVMDQFVARTGSSALICNDLEVLGVEVDTYLKKFKGTRADLMERLKNVKTGWDQKDVKTGRGLRDVKNQKFDNEEDEGEDKAYCVIPAVPERKFGRRYDEVAPDPPIRPFLEEDQGSYVMANPPTDGHLRPSENHLSRSQVPATEGYVEFVASPSSPPPRPSRNDGAGVGSVANAIKSMRLEHEPAPPRPPRSSVTPQSRNFDYENSRLMFEQCPPESPPPVPFRR